MNKRLVTPTAFIVALIAIMISGFIFAGILHFGAAQAQTTTQTTASVRVGPNPGSFGSQVGVYLTIEPPPPTSSDLFHGITVSITRPDGATETIGPFVSNANNSQAFLYYPTMIGSYTFILHYNGESFPDANITYLPTNSKSTNENVYLPQDLPSTSPSKLINSDTTWTKTNSPYTLTGTTAVANGVTLTIEPGVTLNLNSYYLQVNGTLFARGSSTDQIKISDGQIMFLPQSKSWNEQTNSGSVIENSILDTTTITISNASPKLNNNSVSGLYISGGSPIISKNTLANIGISIAGSPIITNNTFTNCVGISIAGSPIITNNTFTNSTFSVSGDNPTGNFPIVSNNIISRGGSDSGIGIEVKGYAYISDNTISDCQTGIFPEFIVGFGGQAPSYPLIERNFIIRNTQGIKIVLFARFDTGDLSPTILNNTISENSVGVYISESNYQPTLTILNNNVQNNTNFNIFLAQGETNNVNATYNWWGTTDVSTIEGTFYDSKNDFTLGTVNFVPFLTAPNSQAMPDPNAPLPKSTHSPSPTQTPTTTSLPLLIQTPTPTPTQSPSPSLTTTPTPTLSSSPSVSLSQQPTATTEVRTMPPLPTELIVALVAIMIIAVAIAAFLLGKRAGRRSTS